MSQQVPATRMNLTLYKTKQQAAKKGYDLLKSKADALKVRFREICKLIYDTKIGLADQSSTAFFSLTQAEYAAGNFRSKVLEGSALATVRVHSKTDNVAGVKLPVFKQYETGREIVDNIGLAAGGRKITVCREKFGDYLKALIKLASLQTSFIAMDEALKITNRRVNALENVTIPKILGTINDINRELDELEREDFTRLKVVKRKKEEAIKADELLKKEALALEKANVTNVSPPEKSKPVAVKKADYISKPSASVSVVENDDTKDTLDDNNEYEDLGLGYVDLAKDDSNNKKNKKKKKGGKKGAEESSNASILSAFDSTEDADVVFK